VPWAVYIFTHCRQSGLSLSPALAVFSQQQQQHRSQRSSPLVSRRRKRTSQQWAWRDYGMTKTAVEPMSSEIAVPATSESHQCGPTSAARRYQGRVCKCPSSKPQPEHPVSRLGLSLSGCPTRGGGPVNHNSAIPLAAGMRTGTIAPHRSTEHSTSALASAFRGGPLGRGLRRNEKAPPKRGQNKSDRCVPAVYREHEKAPPLGRRGKFRVHT
jgi:hypothetical protein